MPSDPRILFLPGASGDSDFWCPVAQRLPSGWETLHLGWPGLGDQPHDPSVGSFDDLAELVLAQLPRASDLVAQSMGGLVAVAVAAQHPEKVRRLVLAATSGGLGAATERARDWREEYRRAYPHAAPWVTERARDHTPLIETIAAPTLLLWGDSDPISPIPVGEHLAAVLPAATLRVIPGGDHSFAFDQPAVVAALIAEHLR